MADGRRRILIVDGSKYFNLTWRMLIPEASFEIAGLARNTDEAMRIASACFPDIVLVDLSHSQTHGLRAIEELRSALPGVPIIASTPVSAREYVRAALRVGASACFAKSEMADVLLQTICQLIPSPAG